MLFIIFFFFRCNDNAYVEHKNQQESHEEKINNISDSVNENLSIK